MFFKRRQNKKIGLFTATAFAVGAMIGGGVFVLSGVALESAGPAALISFIVAGVIVLLSAFSFAVLASGAGDDESGYAYVGMLLTPIWGFLTSWCFYLAAIIGVAFVMNAFGVYMHQFVQPSISVLWWSMIGIGFLTIINLGPASEIGKIESVLVVGKLLILSLLIGVGLAHIDSSTFVPFVPHGTSSVFATSATLFIAYLGFNAITNISGDIENPSKTVPRAIMLSMFIAAIVYIGVVIAMLASGTTDYSEASVGVAAEKLIGPIGGGLVIAGALIATLSAANANMLGSSEIMVRMAAKKEVPTVLGKLYNGHPFISVFFGALLTISLLLLRKSQFVIELANVTAISALIIVNIAAIRAMYDRNYQGFRLSLGPALPILGIIGSVWQFTFIETPPLLIGGSMVAAGVAVYAVRKRYYVSRHHRDIRHAVNRGNSPLGRSLNR